MKKRKMKLYRVFPLILGVLLIVLQVSPILFAEDDDAYDGYSADTLTLEVGYFGGPYYEKRVFTTEELWEMPLVKEDYTFIDNMPSVVIDHVVGVRLDDLMKEAGIDVNSIENFYFWTKDKTSDYYTKYPKTELLDTTRYCYYSLPDNFNSEEGIGLEGADAISSPVPTVMALADDWNRCIKGAEFGSDYMDLNTATRFRLIFGQVDTFTRTANRSAKWVHKIVVELGGMPTVTVDTADLEMEVGSVRRVQAQVSAADSVIAAGTSVTWSSSDESVATVDEEGNVTMVGEGSAVITASAGGASSSFKVSSAQEPEEEEEEPAPDENPDGSGTEEETEVISPEPDQPEEPGIMEPVETAAGSEGTGTGGSGGESVSGSGNSGNSSGRVNLKTSAEEEQTAQNQEQSADEEQEETADSVQQTETKVQEVTLGGSAPLTVSDTAGESGGVQNWRIYEMSESAEELPEIEMDNPLLDFTGAASGVVLFGGGFTEYFLYRRRI